MKVRLEKTFAVPATADAAWALLQDVKAVAECMPGATITERVDDSHYKGTVAIKLGPASLTFRGDVELRDVDPASRSLRLLAKGTDTTGTSGASMELSARVEPDGKAARVSGTSETTMSGKAAAFGGRLANTVAEQVIDRFATNFAARAAAMAPVASSPSAAEAHKPAQLDGFALAWSAFKAWLRSLFSKTHA
jgi:carbon monoxide dehydrogenase subunit G